MKQISSSLNTRTHHHPSPSNRCLFQIDMSSPLDATTLPTEVCGRIFTYALATRDERNKKRPISLLLVCKVCLLTFVILTKLKICQQWLELAGLILYRQVEVSNIDSFFMGKRSRNLCKVSTSITDQEACPSPYHSSPPSAAIPIPQALPYH